MKHQQVLMAGDFFSGCSQVILKASVSKLIQCPCQCERSPPIMDLALKRIPLPHVSASDPSPLGEILRNSWKKTGTTKFMILFVLGLIRSWAEFPPWLEFFSVLVITRANTHFVTQMVHFGEKKICQVVLLKLELVQTSL